MPSKECKMTFTISPDIKKRLDDMKKQSFCECSNSEMIRVLIETGLDAYQAEAGQQNLYNQKNPENTLDNT